MAGSTEIEQEDRAAYAVQLASLFFPWVHRRIETFEFPNAETVRRRVSVDFTVPENEDLKEDDEVYVPISILKKTNLRNFDIVDAQGRSLQMLTAEQNGEVACQGLHQWLRPGWKGDPDELLRCLRGIVEESNPATAMTRAADELAEGAALKEALDGLPVAAVTSLALRALVKELTVGFLLLVPMPYRPGTRQLVKFSFDARIPSDGSPDFSGLPAATVRKIEAVFGRKKRRFVGPLYRKVIRLLSQAGLAARQEDVEGLQLGWSQSYHAELVPPTDMWCAETTLEPRDGPPIRDYDRFRPHLYVANSPRDAVGQLMTLLHPQRDALVFPLALSAVVIASTLAFVPHRLGYIEDQTLAALLVLPFALAAYYVRSAEHNYVTGSLHILRAVAAIPVVAGLLVLAMLGLGYLDPPKAAAVPGHDVVLIAEWAARVSLWAAMLLVVGWITPTIGMRIRRGVRGLEEASRNWPDWERRTVGAVLLVTGLAIYLAALGLVFWLLYPLVTA